MSLGISQSSVDPNARYTAAHTGCPGVAYPQFLTDAAISHLLAFVTEAAVYLGYGSRVRGLPARSGGRPGRHIRSPATVADVVVLAAPF